MANILIILIALSIIQNVYGVNLGKCVQENACICKFDEYSIIDISKITENVDTPYLEDSDSNTNTTFFFSGCKNALLEKTTFSLLRRDLVNGIFHYTSLGIDKDLILNIDFQQNHEYQIEYETSNATITLMCSKYAIPFLKIIDPIHDELIVSSPHACVVTTPRPGLSNGSIFLLLLFITALLYFLGGALLLYFIRGARGVEIIPNVEFWMNLPGLVKDGLVFLLSGCKPTFVNTSETYDRI